MAIASPLYTCSGHRGAPRGIVFEDADAVLLLARPDNSYEEWKVRRSQQLCLFGSVLTISMYLSYVPGLGANHQRRLDSPAPLSFSSSLRPISNILYSIHHLSVSLFLFRPVLGLPCCHLHLCERAIRRSCSFSNKKHITEVSRWQTSLVR